MMHFTLWALPLSVAILGGIIVCMEAGYRKGRQQRRDGEGLAYEGVGSIEAAVFGLLGLLLAFSFSGGMSRLDQRRQLIVAEANAIGTAYLRLDLLGAGAQQPQQGAELRRLLREYLDSRIRVYQKLPDQQAAQAEMAVAAGLQQKIWSKAVTAAAAAASGDGTPTGGGGEATLLLLPAINEMIDVTTSRSVAQRTHLQPLILVLLIAVALLSGLLAGYAMAKRGSRSWLHILAYAMAIAVTVYAVIDLDDPRSGLIRLDAADGALTELRSTIP